MIPFLQFPASYLPDSNGEGLVASFLFAGMTTPEVGRRRLVDFASLFFDPGLRLSVVQQSSVLEH
jgi:hypothetical protein